MLGLHVCTCVCYISFDIWQDKNRLTQHAMVWVFTLANMMTTDLTVDESLGAGLGSQVNTPTRPHYVELSVSTAAH